MAVDIAKSFFRRMAAEGIKMDSRSFRYAAERLHAARPRTPSAFTQRTPRSTGLTFPRHEEEKAVATFVRSIRVADKAFLDDPLWTPLIPNWNRVESALPSFFWMSCARRCGRIMK